MRSFAFIQKEDKRTFELKDEPVFVNSANNVLYILDKNGVISKIEHSKELGGSEKPKIVDFPKIYTGIEGISLFHVNDKNSEIIVAKPEAGLVVFTHFPDSAFQNAPEKNQTFVLKPSIKGQGTPSAKNLCISKNLNFLAFSVGTEIFIYQGPQYTNKSKYKSLSQPEEITNLIINDDGFVYYSTSTQVMRINALDKKIEPKQILDKGVPRGFAFCTANNILHVYVDKKVINFTLPTFTTNVFELPDSINSVSKIGSIQNYVYVAYDLEGSSSFVVYDFIYRLQVFNGDYGKTIHDLTHLWGALILITKDRKVSLFTELTQAKKVEILADKICFDVALRMAEDFKMDEATVTQIHRKNGDYLFKQREYDEAINHYIKTVRFTEPSHVISKFVDPHHAQNLARYLQAIPPELRSKHHTTLLFNCFTKVKDEKKLSQVVDKFVSEASDQEPSFDVKTAVDVLKRNGYCNLAQRLAEAYKMYHLYMDILYEGQQYSEILDFMEKLPGEYIYQKLVDYGAEIMTKYTEGVPRFIQFAIKCCTTGVKCERKDNMKILDADLLASIFVNHPQEHFDFLSGIKNISPLSEISWNTIIELALRIKSPHIDELLNDPDSRYSSEQVIIYLTAFGYDKALPQLYEKLKLYPCLLQKADPEEIASICKKYGNDMPELWSDGLITIADSNCSDETLSQFLDALHEANTIPFLTVLRVLRTHGKHSFAAAQNYVKNVFSNEQKLLRKAKEGKRRCQEAITADSTYTEKLLHDNYKINTHQQCSECKGIINESSHHFLCGHSCHDTCLNFSFCNICKVKHENVVREKIAKLERASKDNEIPEDGYNAMLDDIKESLFNAGISYDGKETLTKELQEAKDFLSLFK